MSDPLNHDPQSPDSSSDDLFRNRIADALRDLDRPESDADIAAALDSVDTEPLSGTTVQRILRQVRHSIATAAEAVPSASRHDRIPKRGVSSRSRSAQSDLLDMNQVRQAQANVRPASSSSQFAIVVACVTLLVGIGALLYQFNGDNSPRIAGRNGLSGSRDELLSVADRSPNARSVVPVEQVAIGQTLSTGPREKRRVTLPDGSILSINEQTTVTISALRRVKLLAGEVFVEVVPVKSRPGKPITAEDRFVVETPNRQVTALGTKFVVKAQGKATNVVVTQGKVQVSGVDQVIPAGQELIADLTESQSVQLRPAKRSAYVIEWVKDLMAAAGSVVVPTSEHTGGTITVVDPQGQEMKLSLRKFHVDVHIEDGFARTTIDQTYFNHTWQQLEGTFRFPLPADASLSRLAMYVNGTLMEGGMVERDYGRNVFEQIRHTRRDPALLEWVDGSTFQMRVFPLEARQEKRILLSYAQRLPSDYGKSVYRFPAGHNLEGVREWSTSLRLKGGAGTKWYSPSHLLSGRDDQGDLRIDGRDEYAMMDRDLVVEFGDPARQPAPNSDPLWSTFDQDGFQYVMLRQRPELQVAADSKTKAERPKRHWMFLVENSADRNAVLAETQRQIAKVLLENSEHSDTFSIIRAGTQPDLFQRNPVECSLENVLAAQKFLSEVAPIGALDLEQALRVVRQQVGIDRDVWIVHMGTGIPVLGERDQTTLLRLLPSQARYVGVAVGKRWSKSFMETAAKHSGGHVTQINPDEAVAWRAFDLLSTLNAPRLTEIAVKSDGADSSAEFLLLTNSLAHGQELAAVARVPKGRGLPKSVTISGKLNGQPYSQTVNVPVQEKLITPLLDRVVRGASYDSTPKSGYLPRTWARLEIDRLVALGAAEHKSQIIELSKSMYVMSPFTSLLVLETEAMYAQFNVDRGRKDHWAMYPAPAQIPVVADPGPAQVTSLDAAKERLKTAQGRAKSAQASYERSVAEKRPTADLKRLERLNRAEQAEVRLIEREIQWIERVAQEAANPVRKAWDSVVLRRSAWQQEYVRQYQSYWGFHRWSDMDGINKGIEFEGWGEPVRLGRFGLGAAVTDGRAWNRDMLFGSSVASAPLNLWAKDSTAASFSVAANEGLSVFYSTMFEDAYVDVSRYSKSGLGYHQGRRPQLEQELLRRVALNAIESSRRDFDPESALVKLKLAKQVVRSAVDVAQEDRQVMQRVLDVELLMQESQMEVKQQSMVRLLERSAQEESRQRLAFQEADIERLAERVHFIGEIDTSGDGVADWKEMKQLLAISGATVHDYGRLPSLRPLSSRKGDPFGRTIQHPDLNGWDRMPPPDFIDIDTYLTEARAGTARLAQTQGRWIELFGESVDGFDRAKSRTYRPFNAGDRWDLVSDFDDLGRVSDGYLAWRAQHPLSGVMKDLPSYAPGLQTWPADRLAIVEQTLANRPKSGDVDPEARRLIEKARSLGWEKVMLQKDRAVLVDGWGRFVLAREVSEGLKETVINDGATLWHLYPEIGLGAKRSLSRFHQSAIQSLIPWYVPSAEDLSVDADLKVIGERTVRITSRKPDVPAAKDPPKPEETSDVAVPKSGPTAKAGHQIAVELVFSEEGGLIELRVIEVVANRVLSKQTFATDGMVRLLDAEGKVLAEVKYDRQSVEAPNLVPATKDLVVLPLPYRSAAGVPVSVPVNLQTNSPDFAKLTDDDALLLLATYFAEARPSELTSFIEQRYTTRGDHRIGLAVLMASVYPQSPLVANATNQHPESPLAKFLVQFAGFPSQGNLNGTLDVGEAASPFLKRVCAAYNHYSRWSTDRAATRERPAVEIEQDLEATLNFIRECRSLDLAAKLLSTVQAGLKRTERMNATFARQLNVATAAIADARGIPAFGRTERIEWLLTVGDEASVAQARELLRAQLADAIANDQMPELNAETRTAFVKHFKTADGQPCGPWGESISEVARKLADKEQHFILVEMARRCVALSEPALAAEIFKLAIKDQDLGAKSRLNLAALDYAKEAGNWEVAEACVQRALADEKLKAISSLWRDAADIAHHRQKFNNWIEFLDRAYELEFAALPATVNVETFRQDYEQLFVKLEQRSEQLIEANQLEREAFARMVQRAAGRWRDIDVDDTAVCHRTAKILTKLGMATAAWNYWTTPLAEAPDQSTVWTAFATAMNQEQRFIVADRAWTTAFECEATNPEILLQHAQFLRSTNQEQRARMMLTKIATSTWQPRFDAIKSQAQALLSGVTGPK